MIKKVMVIINNRASYSRIRSVLKQLKKKNIKLQIITNSSANSDKYGNLIKIIKKDKLTILHQIQSIVSDQTPLGMVKSSGLTLLELCSLMKKCKPDMVLTIADRYETLPIAMAAAYMNIFIAHTQGGEITGSIDESVRHATTKLSHIHFPATKKSFRNIIRMGEKKENVYLTGCPSLDFIPKKIPRLNKNFFKKTSFVGDNINFKLPYIVVLQHSVTTEYEKTIKQIDETIKAVQKLNLQVVWLWPNIDAGSEIISKKIRSLRETQNIKKVAFYKNFEPLDFLRLINYSKCLVGNSSAAIREGSYLGIPAVNIGSRQNFRERGDNVIDVKHNSEEIYKAITKQIKIKNYKKNKLFGDGRAAERIAKIIKGIKKLSIQKKLEY